MTRGCARSVGQNGRRGRLKVSADVNWGAHSGCVGDLGRRRFLALGAGALLTACSAPGTRRSSPAGTSGTAATRAPSTEPTGSKHPTLPTVARWQPSGNDISPGAKLAAVRRIESLGDRPGSVVQVVDAQYGGLLPEAASVLVVTRSWRRGTGGRLVESGRTFDVRVVRSATAWRVVAVYPSHPGPPARLDAAAREVLARRSSIDLPAAARADVLSGRVHDSVLNAMLTLSDSFHLGISVVMSGHPRDVPARAAATVVHRRDAPRPRARRLHELTGACRSRAW